MLDLKVVGGMDGWEKPTFHLKVLMAFTPAKAEFFCVVADKHYPVTWVYGSATVNPLSLSSAQFSINRRHMAGL